MTESNNIFLLNVGFIIHQTVGYVRDFSFHAASVKLPPDLLLDDLSGNVRVTRAAQGLLLQAQMRARVAAECVRCLTEFSQLLEAEFTELYAFNEDSASESGMILPENGKIDLGKPLREEMLLSMPINPLCRPDCAGLCPVCGANLNEMPSPHQNLTGEALTNS